MSVPLPTWPGPAEINPSYLDFGAVLRSPGGGADQKMNRLGNRFALDVTLPPMEDRYARQWLAALMRGQREGVVYEWPQGEDERSSPGAPVVNGGGQAGLALAVRGATAYFAFRVGRFGSVIHGGRRYLHMITAQSICDGAGVAALAVEPMLRAPYADGSLIEIAKPMIEGFLEGNSRDWTLSLARHVGLSFRVVEAE